MPMAQQRDGLSGEMAMEEAAASLMSVILPLQVVWNVRRNRRKKSNMQKVFSTKK